jgi:hypothetical protein
MNIKRTKMSKQFFAISGKHLSPFLRVSRNLCGIKVSKEIFWCFFCILWIYGDFDEGVKWHVLWKFTFLIHLIFANLSSEMYNQIAIFLEFSSTIFAVKVWSSMASLVMSFEFIISFESTFTNVTFKISNIRMHLDVTS